MTWSFNVSTWPKYALRFLTSDDHEAAFLKIDRVQRRSIGYVQSSQSRISHEISRCFAIIFSRLLAIHLSTDSSHRAMSERWLLDGTCHQVCRTRKSLAKSIDSCGDTASCWACRVSVLSSKRVRRCEVLHETLASLPMD